MKSLYGTAQIDAYDHMCPADDVSELQFFAPKDIPFDEIPQKQLVVFMRDYTKQKKS